MSQPKLVRDLMTTEVATLHRNDELSLADRIMNLGRIRHMPVLDEDGDVCGILSQRDLFRSALMRALGHGSVAEDRVLQTLAVKQAMITEVVTASPEMPLAEAARLMTEKRIGCLPVVDSSSLIGILTETDFVATFAK